MAAVQFFGKDSLLSFCNSKEFDAWAVFTGKQLNTSGDNSEDLAEFLTLIEPGGSVAVYTLRLYTGVDPEDIDAKTPAMCAVNFKLGSGQSVGSLNLSALEQRLGRIEEKLSGPDPEDTEPKEDLTDILLGYLREPQKLAVVLGALRGFIAPGAAAPVPAAVGAVHQQKPETMEGDKLQRLGVAIDTLEKKDPQLVEHLEKLAQLATEKPAVFSMLLSMLDNNAV